MRLGEGRFSGTPKTWVRDATQVESSRPRGPLQETKKTRIVVYTALFGEEDLLWSVPPTTTLGVKYVVFTERPRREVGLWTYNFGWERPAMLQETEETSPLVRFWEQRIVKAPYNDRKSARYYKAMAHKVLRDADISIWIDANVRLLIPPAATVRHWINRRDLVVFKHPRRGCLFEEVNACLKLRKDSKDLLVAQSRAYRGAGMPRGWGLATTRCVVRRHTLGVAKLNEAWWKEIQRYSLRDQISLPFVCWKVGFQWEMIPRGIRGNRDFWFLRHGGSIRGDSHA